jgi:hypothetical protein
MPVSGIARSDKGGVELFSALFLFEGTSVLFTLRDWGVVALRFGARLCVLDFSDRAFFIFDEVTFGISTLDQTLILSVGK